MKKLNVSPGDIIATLFGTYHHYSLVTDRICEEGLPMLISATKRNGTVREETWNTVTQGKQTYITKLSLNGTVEEVLAKARSRVDSWKYSLAGSNCEHFVNWARGVGMTSNQVQAGVAGGLLGAIAVGVLSEEPKTLKVFAGAALMGAIAVSAAKAAEKKKRPSP